MLTESRLRGIHSPAPSDDLAGRFRDAIALRCRRSDVEFPRACDLEAAVLEALHAELHGVASALSGIHTAENWRERLRGERTMPLADLCRLCLDPTREGKAAAVAALSLLARAAGYLLAPATTLPGSLVESAITAASVATDALGEVARAVSDGVIDAAEAAELRKRAGDLRHAAARLEGAVISAEGKR